MAIGLHISPLLQTGRDHLDDTLARLGKSAPHVVLDEQKLALELKAAAFEVFYRHKYDDDADYRAFNADTFWAHNAPLAAAGIPVVWMNEPVIKNEEDAQALLAAYRRVSAARPQAARLVVAGFSTGNPHEDLIKNSPALGVLLREIVKAGDILGLHEYAPVAASTDTVQLRPWHFNRYRFWVDRCLDDLKIVPPRIVISECGYDVGGGAMDGWLGDKPIAAEVYAELIEAQAAEYRAPGYEVDACLFAWGNGFNWASFNIERSAPIIDAMVNANRISMSPPAAPPPVTSGLTDWQPRKLRATGTLTARLRALANINAAIVYRFIAGSTYDVQYDPLGDKPDIEHPDLVWRRIKYGAVRGFIRSDAAELLPEPDITPAPPPVVEPPNANVVFTIAELSAISSSLGRIYDANAKIAAQLLAVNEELGNLRLQIADAISRAKRAAAA